jgi:hypothetical protein
VRVALEHEARSLDERGPDEPVSDAALWRASNHAEGGLVRAVFVQSGLALVIDDEDGDLKRVGVTGYRRTHGGWSYVFSEFAGTGDFTGPGPREASGWNNDIAWALGRGGPGEAVRVQHRHP